MRENAFKKARSSVKNNGKTSDAFKLRQMPSEVYKLSPMSYTPVGIKNVDIFDLRKEYARIRSIVKKRAGRLEEKGIITYVVTESKNLPTATEIGLDRELLESKLIDAVQLYKAPTLYDINKGVEEVQEIRRVLDIGMDINDDELGQSWKIIRELLPLSYIDSPRVKAAIERAIDASKDDPDLLVALISDIVSNIRRNNR